MKAVADLNYYPNLNARSLAGGKNRTLGMIASNLENPFFFDVFRTLEADAHARGYELVAANTGYNPEQLLNSVRLMIGRRVGGLAVIVSEMEPDLILELERSNIPVVFYDVGIVKPKISNIRVNYRRGIEEVVKYLHGLGHRKLAFIGHHSTLGPTSEREKTFTDTAPSYEGTEYRTVVNQDGPDGGREAARELLDSGYRPTAIICVNDFMALGVLRELRERGMRVPEDVSVTGFDDITLAEYCYPALTTVHIPRDRIGHLVFEALTADSDRASATGHEVVVEPELVVRQSTAPAGVPQ